MAVSIQVDGSREVELKLLQFPQRLHERLLPLITELTEQLYGAVKAAEPNRSGALSTSTQMKMTDRPTRITGTVFINADFAKASALEYGASRATQVKAHMQRLDHVFSRLISPVEAHVGAYNRTPNIREYNFLRGPLEAMSSAAVDSMRAVIDEVIEED